VGTFKGNMEHRGGEDGRWNPDLPRHGNNRKDRNGLRLCDAPLGFDRVIVSRLVGDGMTGSARRQMDMKVSGNRCSSVVQFRSVNVEKRRLQGAPD
jgi:hypothetical protein